VDTTENSCASIREGRVKDKNIRRDPRVSVAIQDPANPYRYLEIRGKSWKSQKTCDNHINKLSQKYLGNPVYPFRKPGEVRVTYKIEPQKVTPWLAQHRLARYLHQILRPPTNR